MILSFRHPKTENAIPSQPNRRRHSRFARFGALALCLVGMQLSRAGALQPFWVAGSNPQAEPANTHTAFRGSFELKQAEEVEIRFLGATFFNLWLDGEMIADGPAR
jgi:hypothetical protein